MNNTAPNAFTSDGNWLVYRGSDAAGKGGILRVATTGGEPKWIGDYPKSSVRGDIWISPDGKKLLFLTFGSEELWMLENFEPKQQAVK